MCHEVLQGFALTSNMTLPMRLDKCRVVVDERKCIQITPLLRQHAGGIARNEITETIGERATMKSVSYCARETGTWIATLAPVTNMNMAQDTLAVTFFLTA